MVITVSREAGSGGKLIAKRVAKLLKIELIDEQLMDMLATQTRQRKEVIKKLDERERDHIKDLVKRLLDPEYISKNTFIKNLVLVVSALAEQKSCVILGRGANFILGGRNSLNIRIVAPFLKRVYYTQKFEKRTKVEAEQRVRQFDRERKEFIRQYFGKNPSNANYYDLVINTEGISIDETVKTIVRAAKIKLTAKKQDSSGKIGPG